MRTAQAHQAQEVPTKTTESIVAIENYSSRVVNCFVDSAKKKSKYQ